MVESSCELFLASSGMIPVESSMKLRSIGSFKMFSELRYSLRFPAISLGIFGSPKKSFDLERGRHCSYLNLTLPGSSAAHIYRNPNSLGFQKYLKQQPNSYFSVIRSVYTDFNLAAVADVEPFSNDCIGSRITRMNRADAQHALFDYLHGTRCLQFTDAEYISKNCPIFLQNLLSKIENKHNVGRSLTRFLRYHPINEFEPFFESLGLKPSKLHALLPRNLMFLSDDDVLLENYHSLCNYGVPRSKIGKMYKEGIDMFRYDFGVLYSKLQAYENLGLSKPTVIKLVTCCPALLIGEVNIEFLQVLQKMRSLGIELDWIRGCLSDKSTYFWNRILSMLNFLDEMGCERNELAALIKNNPRFIFDDSGKKIYSFIAVMLKLGLRTNVMLSFLVQHPGILVGNFTKNLVQSVHFLTEIGMAADDIARILSSHAQVLGSCSCKKPDVVLENLNVSAKRLCEIIKEDPGQFTTFAICKKVGSLNLPKIETTFLQEKSNFLLRIGFVENTDEMAKALRKFRGRGDQLQERYDSLVNAGLDCHTVSEMIKLVPTILNQSTDVIEKKIDYLLNHLGYPLQSLEAFPTFLCYNMEKIKLRFSMYTWLKEQEIPNCSKNNKVIKSNAALSSILACSDERFVKYFVNLHPEGPNEWNKLKSVISLR